MRVLTFCIITACAVFFLNSCSSGDSGTTPLADSLQPVKKDSITASNPDRQKPTINLPPIVGYANLPESSNLTLLTLKGSAGYDISLSANGIPKGTRIFVIDKGGEAVKTMLVETDGRLTESDIIPDPVNGKFKFTLFFYGKNEDVMEMFIVTPEGRAYWLYKDGDFLKERG